MKRSLSKDISIFLLSVLIFILITGNNPNNFFFKKQSAPPAPNTTIVQQSKPPVPNTTDTRQTTPNTVNKPLPKTNSIKKEVTQTFMSKSPMLFQVGDKILSFTDKDGVDHILLFSGTIQNYRDTSVFSSVEILNNKTVISTQIFIPSPLSVDSSVSFMWKNNKVTINASRMDNTIEISINK